MKNEKDLWYSMFFLALLWGAVLFASYLGIERTRGELASAMERAVVARALAEQLALEHARSLLEAETRCLGTSPTRHPLPGNLRLAGSLEKSPVGPKKVLDRLGPTG